MIVSLLYLPTVFTVSYLIFDLTLNVPMRLPRKFLICSHLLGPRLGCAFSDQHDHRPFCKVVDVGREREAISQDFEASPGMIARLHKFYNKSHDQYLRRTRSTWSCKGAMLCRTLQLAGASLLHRALPPNLRKVLHSMKTFTNANMFCLDPEKAGLAMIILPLMALVDQFGAEMKKLGIRF